MDAEIENAKIKTMRPKYQINHKEKNNHLNGYTYT